VGAIIEAPARLAQSETGLTILCNLIGGYLYLANQVWESGFDFAKSIMV
jgi:hypothetical protein